MAPGYGMDMFQCMPPSTKSWIRAWGRRIIREGMERRRQAEVLDHDPRLRAINFIRIGLFLRRWEGRGAKLPNFTAFSTLTSAVARTAA